jgi:outer membrane receptor protein involved in Fe transport
MPVKQEETRMRERFSKGFAATLLGSVGVPLLTTIAAAQTGAPPSPAGTGGASSSIGTLEEIIVTAQKREEKISDVPLSITAISADTLERQNDTRFEDFAARVPGLSYIGTRPGIAQISLRGVTTGPSQPNASVATYVDETPLTSSTIFASGSLLTPDFDTTDIERIEVLRGPQGTLYGANALGGILKYVTAPPGLSAVSGRVEVDGTSVAGGDSGYGVRGTINAPIIEDRVAGRINVFKRKDPGYVDDPTTGRTDVGGSDVEGGRASVLAKINDDLSVRLTAFGQHLDGRGIASEDVVSPGLTPYYGDLVQKRLAAEFLKLRNAVYNATVNWSVGAADVVSSSSYSETTAHAQQDYSFQVAPLAAALPPLALGAGLNNAISQRKFTQEIRLQSPATNELEWRLGLFYTHEQGNRQQTINPIAAVPVALYDVTFSARFNEYAGFGDLTYHFTPKFDITAGARISKNDQTFHQISRGLLLRVAPGRTFLYDSDSSDRSATFLINPRWRPTDDLMIYGRIASGYRPGGPNVVSPGSAGVVPAAFDPDRLINYEVGAKGNVLGGKLAYDASVFYIDWTDVQIVCLVGGLTYECNGGKAKSQGVEANLTYHLLPGLTFNVNGAYTDASLTTDVRTISARSGDPLPFAPRWSGSASLDYQRALFSAWDGFAGVTDRYTGSRQSTYSLDTTRLTLPAFNLVDVRLGVTNPQWTVTLFAKNVGNERGITNVSSETVLSASSLLYAANILQPRTIGLSVSMRF